MGTPGATTQRDLECQQLLIGKAAAHVGGHFVQQLGDDGVGLNGPLNSSQIGLQPNKDVRKQLLF